MVTTSRYLEAPRRLRAFVRAHETSLVVLAALAGIIGGWVVVAMSVAVATLHALLFNIDIRERLSSQFSIDPWRAVLVPSLGGLALGLAFLLLQRWRPAREIDPIEANALHGGRMSFRGSVIVALQTVWSSGVGASVGLEAGYTQLASGLAASLGRAFHLRRADQRIMVGCGAAAAMRQDVATVDADMGIEEFRSKFPLGSKTQVVAVDAAGRYVGLALVADAHTPDVDAKSSLAGILHHRNVVLHPVMNIQEAIAVFDTAEAESLAVVESGGEQRPIGILTEAHAMRRYAEESDNGGAKPSEMSERCVACA
jgi:hypothetical protein